MPAPLDPNARIAYNEGMMLHSKIQYTLRQVPKSVDQALRRKAHQEKKSINTVALEALKKGIGEGAQEEVYHDLDDLVGSWEEDEQTTKALELQRKIDKDMWP